MKAFLVGHVYHIFLGAVLVTTILLHFASPGWYMNEGKVFQD
jgi:hypothetical protein